MLAGAAAASWAYFSETKTSPQPISVAAFGAAAIKYETAATPVTGDTTTLTVNRPAGVQAGWVLVATVGAQTATR